MLTKIKTNSGQFLRDIVFGFNDAILTNLGIVAGFSLSLVDNRLIVIACLVDVFISAFAMSFGTYMSRTSEQDFLKTQLSEKTHADASEAMGHPITASVVMWITYVIAGFVPVAPFLFGLESHLALKIALVAGISTFFLLGAAKGYLTQTKILKSAIQFLLFGVVSAGIGLLVGRLASGL
jgi:predicted membrane protein (TIGR00267 family)